MNAHEIKPKSIRLSILTALAANGITTVDDLQTQLDQPRKTTVDDLQTQLDQPRKTTVDDLQTQLDQPRKTTVDDLQTQLDQPRKTTVDDLQTQLDQPRKTIVDNALHAINDQLIERVRDDVTGLAAYQITPAGRKFLANHAKEEPEAEKKVAPIERKIEPAPAAVQKQPNPPPTEKRPQPPPPPPAKKAEAKPATVELIPEETFTVKVNGAEFFGMKLVSSWEGLRKLEDSTGRWIIVMATESPMLRAMSETFGKVFSNERASEIVIPVSGSVAFKDAMTAEEVAA